MTTKIKLINPAVTPTVAGIVATSVSQFTDVNIPDNNAVRLGSSQELKLYHTGTHSYIENGAGTLFVDAAQVNILDGANTAAAFTAAGAVTLYNAGSPKLTTDSAGINVTGGIDVADITATGNVTLNSDGGTAYFGAGADLRIFHDGNNSFINNTGGAAGALSIKSHDINIMDAQSHNMAVFTQDGAVTLYHDNSPKIATNTAGATVTGTLTVTGDLDITGNVNSYNVTDLDITDKTITLGSGQTEANSGGSGIIIDGSSASMLWDETNGEFDFNNPLSIVNSIGGDTVLNLTGSYGSGNPVALLGFARAGGAVSGDIRYVDATTDMEIGTGTAHGFSLKTGGTRRLNITNAGLVGIGTDTPDTGLHLKGNSNVASGFTIEQVYGGSSKKFGFQPVYNDDRLDIWYNSNATSAMTIKDGGNIGIGTTAPQRSLDVRHALNIFGSGGYTELMLRGRAGTAQNLGAFHWSIRGDVGGNNDDLMLLRFTGGNSPSYSGTSMHIRNDNGYVGIGTNTGQPNSPLHIRSAGTGNVLYVESSDGHHLGGFYQESDTRAAFNVRDASGSVKVNLDAGGNSWFTGGNVGIGASSVSSWAKLQVAGTAGAQTDAKQALYIQSPTATANEGVGMRMSAASGSHEAVGIIGMVNNASGNAGSMTFHTYNLGATIPEVMRLDNKGNLGLGVVPTANWWANSTALQISPTASLWNTSTYEDFNIGNNVYTDGTDKYLQNDAACKIRLTDSGLMDFRVASAGTAGNAISFITALAIDSAGALLIDGSQSKAAGKYDMEIGNASKSHGVFLRPYMFFGTRYSSWDTNLGWNATADVMTTNSGIEQGTGYGGSGASNLIVGADTLSWYRWAPAQTTGAGTSLAVNSTYLYMQASTSGFNIKGTYLSNASDRRLKDNITPITNALDKVKQLTGNTFTWKTTLPSTGIPIPEHKAGKADMGVIAQEVQAVVPTAVQLSPWDSYIKEVDNPNFNGDLETGGPQKISDPAGFTSVTGEDYLTVNEEKLVPLLIEAIKELEARVAELEG